MIAGGGEQRKLPELPPAGNNNIYENGSVAGSDMMYDTVGYSTGLTNNAIVPLVFLVMNERPFMRLDIIIQRSRSE